jgi:Pectate lyase superfamily protein
VPPRLIGTDSANPRLPQVVIDASIGTTHHDVAPGDALADAKAYTDQAIADVTVGAVDFADNTETLAGTATTKAVTPAGLDAAVYDTEPINAARWGFTRAAVIAALDAAEARGKGTVVYFPAGTYELGTGLSLSGYSVQIRGDGAGGTTTTPSGTVFKASTQTGPVLDFTGWQQPQNFQGRTIQGGFHVIGSGVADATKANAGIRLASISSVTFSDISIRNTGGPCLEGVSSPGNAVYLCDFERITLNTPVSAKANDVAWMTMNEPNGTRFRSFGLRSTIAAGDVGISGAVILQGNATFSPHDNLFDGWWIEALHVPTNGTVFHFAANATVVNNFQFFDTSKEAGATGTSHFRFAPPTVNDFGGNLVTGIIPGKDPGVTTSIDMGVDMRQSRNSVYGIKGYKGTNVVLATGVGYTTVDLGGMVSAALDAAVVDNSGQTTNRWYDPYTRTLRTGAQQIEDYSGVGPGTMFKDPANLANGNIWLGNAGASIRTAGVSTYIGADNVLLRNIANNAAPKIYVGPLNTYPSINVGAGAPAVAAAVGSIYLRTDGGAVTSLYVKESGTSTTAWVAK